MIDNKDSLEFLRTFEEFTFDINYSDPPYQLGSEVIVRSDGMVDYKKSVDFMNKWGGLSGDYWNDWFKEAYRTLKHGGYLIMFGMDRQLLLFKYYANLAGFTEQQSLYWYFISNFPKATDLSKKIDSFEMYGKANTVTQRKSEMLKDGDKKIIKQTNNGLMGEMVEKERNLNTKPSTELAKKYEGYKYSISPLKQTNETILIFQKPYKTGSCLHDTLAYENGDDTCCCGALDIDGNRVGTETRINETNVGRMQKIIQEMEFRPYTNGISNPDNKIIEVEGRYPSQTFCDSNTAEVLDKQSGVSKSIRSHRGGARNDGTTVYQNIPQNIDMNYEAGYTDTGGCSKILHKCDFEKNEYDLYFYNPKVSRGERNAGCDEFEDKIKHWHDMENAGKDINNPKNYLGGKITHQIVKNNHPTLKPIKLNERILKLFKTPNEQKIIYPFAGSGSEIIGGIKAGFTNWVGCEINHDYVEIAKARIDYWSNKFDDGLDEMVVEKKIDESQVSLFDLMEEEK